MPLNYREVAEILKIIDASNCDELVLEIEGTKLVVRRYATGDGASTSRSASNPTPTIEASPAASDPASVAVSSPPSANGLAPERWRDDGLVEVRAPMVGTFYRGPSPTAPAFIEIGSEVEAGDPLCLIEVMKLYTTIEAPNAGRVAQIGAENGALVEYGHVLVVIEPA